MYNWLKSLFGFRNCENNRVENDLVNNNNNNMIDNCIKLLEEDFKFNNMPVDRSHSQEIWPFIPMFFTNVFEINKHLDKMMEEMTNKFNIYGFDNFPSHGFENIKNDVSNYFEYPGEFSQIPQNERNMRDYVLNKKPGLDVEPNDKRDLILNDHIDDQVKDLLEYGDQLSIMSQPMNKNNFHSFKSVVVKISKQPDGTVHIMKKVTDSSGKDETTYTIQSNK